MDYLQQQNRDMEKRLEDALIVADHTKLKTVDLNEKNLTLEAELEDVDRMAKQLQLSKSVTVLQADRDIEEAKVRH